MHHNVTVGADCCSKQAKVWGCGEPFSLMPDAGVLGYFVSHLTKSQQRTGDPSSHALFSRPNDLAA